MMLSPLNHPKVGDINPHTHTLTLSHIHTHSLSHIHTGIHTHIHAYIHSDVVDVVFRVWSWIEKGESDETMVAVVYVYMLCCYYICCVIITMMQIIVSECLDGGSDANHIARGC